jgi:hypothetical protein
MGTPVGMMFAYARVCFLERILTMGVTILFIPLNEVVWSNSCDQFVPGLHIRHAGHGQCMSEWFASLRPSASTEMSHGATSWRLLFWFHTCMFYFVRRWLRVKLRRIVWIRIILVRSWRTMFSIVLHDRKRSTKDSYLSVLTSLLMFVLVSYHANTSLGCALCCFWSWKGSQNQQRHIRATKKQLTKTKSFLFFKKGIIDKEERYRNRLKS